MNKRNAAATLFTALLLATGCGGNDADKPLASAKEYLLKGDSKAATIQLKNALQAKPELAEARFLLGTILLNEGNAGAAEIELRKAQAAKYPDNLVVPELAAALLASGQAKKVVEEFGQAQLGNAAADARLQTALAAAYGVSGKPELAEAALKAALNAEPGNAQALILRARQKAAARDVDGALATLDEVLAKDAGNADAWLLKGDLLLYAKGEPDTALAAYAKAVQAKPNFAPGYFAALTLLLRQNKLDDAEKQLQGLKRFAANDPQTKYFEAKLAFQKKDYALAKSLMQPLLAAAPNNPRILELAGAIELRLGALPQAEAHLAAAVQAAPQLGMARRLLITTYLRTGQPAKALAALNAVAGKDSLDPSLFTLAGQAYLQSGDAKKAEEYFAKALKLDPRNADKRTALAVAQLSGAETASAYDELQNIAEADSGSSADLALISAHLARKDFKKALAAVDKLEAKQTDKPLAANLRGRIQLAQKDNAAARKSFEQALKIDPSYFAAAASLAALDLADTKPADARKRYEGLLAKNPKNGQALLGLAEIAEGQGAGKAEVAALLQKAIDANPGEAAPRLLLINLHLRAKDNKLATAAAQNAVSAMPNNPDVLDALGRVQLESGETNQALATFQKLASMQPHQPMPQLRLAAAHMSNKDPQAAEKNVRKALELKPDDAQIQRSLVALLLEQKKVSEALTLARTVQKQQPKRPTGYALESDIHVAQRDWGASAGALRAGLQAAPSTELATNLHAVLVAAGKPEDAERFASSWLKAQPKDTRFIGYLGEAAFARKDYAQAEKQFLAVLQLQPDNAVALNNLAWAIYQLQKPGAMAYAQRANARVPNEPAFMDTLAMLLSAEGQHTKAIELQLKALELQPANAGVRLNLAKIYVAAGDKPRAKAELEALAKLGDKHPLSAQALALLKTL